MVICGAFDSTKKESTTPKGVASTSLLPPRVASYRRQPRAIESITPMGLHHHHHLSSHHNVGCDHTTTWNCVPHGHLSSRHNAGCADATTSDCTPHGHSSPNHGIGMVRNMAIYHHATTRGITIPFRWGCATTALYYHIITWRVNTPF